MFPISEDSLVALAGSATLPPLAWTGLNKKHEIISQSPDIVWHLLAGAAGDHALAADGDLAEDGQGVARQEVQLRVAELGVGHEFGEASVITWKILLESIFTSGQDNS